MEQKQLDDLDESFFGEEFVEDEEPMKIEKIHKKESKDLFKDNFSKKDKKVVEKVSTKKAEAPPKSIFKSLKSVKMAKMEKPKKVEKFKEIKVEKAAFKKEEDDVLIHSVKESAKDFKDHKESTTIILDKPPVRDIWEDNKESGFFKEAGTWKAITGIVIILLLFSIFTQGFKFPTKGEISMSQAEEKTLAFVNENLLRKPFAAEVQSTIEESGLYKITLSVGGETIDSYITKDGKIFFPQGFLTETSLADQLSVGNKNTNTDANTENADKKPTAAAVSTPVVPEPAVETIPAEPVPVSAEPAPVTEDKTPVNTVAETPVETVVQPEPVTDRKSVPGSKEFNVAAKKWLFEPVTLSVNKGDTVSLVINPTFDFTFSLPAFKISKAVSGKTVVEFTADKVGTFDYSCSSCENWRGMSGRIVVS